jgi:hypothetical protein
MTVPRQREGEPAGEDLLVLAPLRVEARAVRSLRDRGTVLRTGLGAAKARRAAQEIGQRSFGQLMIMGTAVGLADELRPGDLVVDASQPSAPQFARGSARSPP